METRAREASGDRSWPAVPAGLGLVALLVAGVLFTLAAVGEQRRDAALHWPSARGRVRDASLSTFRRAGETQDEQNAVTTYEWDLEGHHYEATEIEYVGYGTTGHEGALHHRTGDEIVVYYDPGAPSEGKLTNRLELPVTLLRVLGGVLSLVSVPLFLHARREWSRARRSRAP